ncbi:MAG: D-alanyl-D-alanine carboxypeptidase [Polyangiales bacterium]
MLGGDYRFDTEIAVVTAMRAARPHFLSALAGDRPFEPLIFKLGHRRSKSKGDDVARIVVDQSLFGGVQTPPSFDEQPNETAAFRAAIAPAASTLRHFSSPLRRAQSARLPWFKRMNRAIFLVDNRSKPSMAVRANSESRWLPFSHGHQRVDVVGTIGTLEKKAAFRQRVVNASEYAKHKLRYALDDASIGGTRWLASGNIAPDARRLFTYRSEPNSAELLKLLGKHSQQLRRRNRFCSLSTTLP